MWAWNWRVAALIGLLGIFAPASAQESATPEPKVDRFGDWSVVCLSLPEGGEFCRAVQSIGVKESNQTVMEVAIGPGRPAGERLIIISVPLGVFLPPGVMMRVDGAQEQQAPFQSCSAAGCHAAFPLTEENVELLRKGKQLLVTVLDSRRQPVAVPTSLSGFSDAIAKARPTW